MDEHITQLRKGALELAVLALLARQPHYGGAVVEALNEVGLDVATGTIYPVLARLKKAELVDTHWEESPYGPPRKFYTPTPDGLDALASMTTAWRELDAAIGSLLPQPSPVPAEEAGR